MSSKPSGPDQDLTAAQVRRRILAIAMGLFLPIFLIWFGAATIVARGLQFPPALAYSTSGAPVSGKAPAASGGGPLRESLGIPADEIVLRSSGRNPLRALIAPSSSRASAAVMLAYPNRVDPQVLVSYFRIIRSAGYPALIIEYEDPLVRYGFGWSQRGDVLDAVAALRARGVQRIAVLGVSEGAAAALFAAAEGAPLAAIISDSSYAELAGLLRRIPPLDSLNPLFDRTILWELGLMTGRPIGELAPARAAAQLHGCPLMVINGADDPLVPPADARKIFDAAHGPRELWIVQHAGHAAALAVEPQQYTRRVGAFLSRYLGSPGRRAD